MNSSEDPVCLVTSVGPDKGTGAEIARRFAKGGYRVAMLARSSERLLELQAAIPSAQAFPCDVSDIEALKSTIANVREQLGTPKVVVHNALRSVRSSILELDPEDLEKNFRVNTTALLHLARETVPGMLDAGGGAILVTGNTSATRGKAHWSAPRHREVALERCSYPECAKACNRLRTSPPHNGLPFHQDVLDRLRAGLIAVSIGGALQTRNSERVLTRESSRPPPGVQAPCACCRRARMIS